MKEEKYNEKANISNKPETNPHPEFDNEEIEVIPYEGPVVAEAVAVTYGPDPCISEHLLAHIDDDDISERIDEIMIVDINSDMYGAPLPDDFYITEIDSSDYIPDLMLPEEGPEATDKDNESDDMFTA